MSKVHGYDPAFWYESYDMLRKAIMQHLGYLIHDDDVAEEAILASAVEEAGKRLRASAPEEEREARPHRGAGAMSERDIVERLRDFNEVARRVMADEARRAGIDPSGESIVDEAMAEIERLRASSVSTRTPEHGLSYHDGTEALREALEEIAEHSPGEHHGSFNSYECGICESMLEVARRALSQHVGGEG